MIPLKYWSIDDFEISSHSFKLEERKNKTYNTSGSDNTGICTYTYNELGFRGDSIEKQGFKIMSLGCSLTEGVGVNDFETWPSRISQQIPNSVNLNFGTGGRSNDFIARCLISYFDYIKPDLVLILYTYPNRREFYDKDGGINPYSAVSSWGYFETEEGKEIQNNLILAQNDNENYMNWYKNHLLISNFLQNKGCNWIWDGSCVGGDYTDKNHFKSDFNTFLDVGSDGKHPGPIHHMTYAQNLISFISKTHPTFLPASRNS